MPIPPSTTFLLPTPRAGSLGEAPLWILWPSLVSANPLSTLRHRRGMDAGSQAHLQADEKGPLLLEGAQEPLLHSNQLRGPARCASPSEPECRASGPRGRAAVPRPLRHLARLPPRRSSPAPSDPRFLIPRLPPSSSRPLLGPASPGPERHAGAVGTWSRSCRLQGAPGRTPEALQFRRSWFDSWIRKIPWRKGHGNLL